MSVGIASAAGGSPAGAPRARESVAAIDLRGTSFFLQVELCLPKMGLA